MLVGDTLTSLVSGMGTSRDKAMSLFWTMDPLGQQNLEAAYRADWIARKVIDVPPNDATREWRNWQAEDAQIQALEETERRLDVRAKVRRSMQLARLYGGAALLMGDGSATPDQPFDPETVKLGGLKYLHVFPRWRLSAGELDWDPESPYFGTPVYYGIPIGKDREEVRIHPSRVIRFVGQPVPDPFIDGQFGWGDSILQSIGDAVRDAGLASRTIASLLMEAKTDSIGIPDLFEYLTTEAGLAKVRQRYALAAETKSLYNTVLRDAAEVWETRQINFAQLPDLLREYLQIAAGAADIPATRLLGKAPQGLNATGESDLVNYYNMVSSMQENDLRPQMAPLDEALIRDALGARPAEVHYEWSPLWQPTAGEQADVALKKAQATQIYAVNDLLPPGVLAKVVANQLTEDGTYPGVEAAMADYEAGLVADPDWQQPDPSALAGPVDPNAAQAAPKIDPATGKPVTDAAPRTLYVSRTVENADEIIAWAKGQGFKTTLRAADLHVTVVFSRSPVDWMKAGENYSSDRNGTVTIEPGGPRMMEQFNGGAVALLFASNVLSWRHINLSDIGASWDFPEYQPHITITYDPGAVDLAKVTPYQGKIVLGPEIFAEVNEDWKAGVTEDGGGPTGRTPFRRGQTAPPR